MDARDKRGHGVGERFAYRNAHLSKRDECLLNLLQGPQPRPTNGIWFAITVMNSTFVESGRFAM